METTMTDIIAQLRKEGYTEDFNVKQHCLECHDGEYVIFHNEFVIDKVFRFEGMSDPDDESIVYAISSPRYRLKGILVNGYGIYSEPLTDEMLAALNNTGQQR
ncbi:MAG: phosphoribosylpyrophosphate synthetase [Candidatus Kapabacteria bacterium]|nr:phosphoribosylpyrophosphate synthetase [Candidatus Kapabacteria bacterium]